MASRKVKKPKKRAQRATSNVFAMFAQDQIQVSFTQVFYENTLQKIIKIYKNLVNVVHFA